MKMSASRVLPLAVLAAVGLSLTGCSSIREAAGMNKMAPDEFAVQTKAPLVIPPDFSLMPPKPGAAPTNQTDPTTTARSALLGQDAAGVAANMPGEGSMSEKLLLARAGAADADSQIRQRIAADDKNMLAADDGFTDQILFWQDKKSAAAEKPVDAEAEAKRLDRVKTGQQPPASPQTGDKPAAADPQPEEKKSSGWFDGWFDWF
jgi:hypothetical protein